MMMNNKQWLKRQRKETGITLQEQQQQKRAAKDCIRCDYPLAVQRQEQSQMIKKLCPNCEMYHGFITEQEASELCEM